jgi:hypothetical protein
MNDADLDALIMNLQSTTPLVRLNQPEARSVFEKLAELGYTITKPAPVNG